MNKSLCVFGGDLRQETVYNLLLEDGYNVEKLALSCDEIDLNRAKGYDIIILPLPVSFDNTYINTPLCDDKIKIDDLISKIRDDCILLGGNMSYEIKSDFSKRGILYYDYYAREELIIKNAIPTAEGAIEIALSELPITLFGCNALVCGFGRIGKMLAYRLKAFGADVYVSARKYSDFAWIEELGCTPINTSQLDKCISRFDVVFNTIPAQVVGFDVLKNVKDDTLIIDLASKPGGVDFNAAKDLGKRVI